MATDAPPEYFAKDKRVPAAVSKLDLVQAKSLKKGISYYYELGNDVFYEIVLHEGQPEIEEKELKDRSLAFRHTTDKKEAFKFVRNLYSKK